MGFEPTEPVKAQQFSRLPDSTTLAPLRERMIVIVWGGVIQVEPEGTTKLHERTQNRNFLLLVLFRVLSWLLVLPLGFEEILHQRTAFVGEDAGCDLDAMI